MKIHASKKILLVAWIVKTLQFVMSCPLELKPVHLLDLDAVVFLDENLVPLELWTDRVIELPCAFQVDKTFLVAELRNEKTLPIRRAAETVLLGAQGDLCNLASRLKAGNLAKLLVRLDIRHKRFRELFLVKVAIVNKVTGTMHRHPKNPLILQAGIGTVAAGCT